MYLSCYLFVYLYCLSFAGIGRGIAVKLAALGAKVHAISRTQADLDSLKQEV